MTATTGTAPVSRAESSSREENGVTPSPSSAMMRSRVGAWASTTATETRMAGWVAGGALDALHRVQVDQGSW